ncbi:MAG: PTS sugar transporter subunit IIC [Chloroflexi bacterium]|nr:PTS sugar transporter subunit IIC [Chloroflexota bacterium]
MSPLDVAVVALLGGILGLDTVGFPQAMLSRPIVAATLGGALVGSAEQGLLVGAALELFAIETLPFGASRYPEWGSSSVVGGALLASRPEGEPGSLTFSVLVALVVAWAGGWSMMQLRRFNARRARRRLESLAAGSRGAVLELQLGGLTADLLRGFVLTAVAVSAAFPLQQAVLQQWSLGAAVSRAVVVGVAAGVALGATFKLFHNVPGFAWQFIVGLAAGVLALLAI